MISILITWSFFLLEGVLCSLFTHDVASNSFEYCFFVIVANAIVFILENGRNKKYSLHLVLGFMLRCLLLLWDCNFSGIYRLPNSGQDTYTYHYGATSGLEYGTYGRGGLYSQILCILYRLFGVQMPIGQYMNVLLSMATILIVIRIMQELQFSDKAAKTAVILLSYLPNLAVLNAILLKETPVIFCVTLSMLFLFRWYRTGSLMQFILSIAAGLLGSAIHSGAISMVAGAAVFFVLYNPRTQRLHFTTRRIGLVVLFVVLFLFLSREMGDTFLYKFSTVDSAEDIIHTADSYNAGGSSYSIGIPIANTYLNLIVNTPIRMFYFVVSPMPWDWRGLNDIIAFAFDSTLFLCSIWMSVRELRLHRDTTDRSVLVLLVILALVSAVIFAWGVSNAGSALRHREKFITVFVLLIAACRERSVRRRRKALESQS